MKTKPECYGTYPINPVMFKCMICEHHEDCYNETAENTSKPCIMSKKESH
jgi:hypothetical protein